MQAIQKALDEIKFNIPKEILDLAFIDRGLRHHGTFVSLDHRIRSEVLEPRVIVDINLQGATTTHIPLQSGFTREQTDPFIFVYAVPEELTQGREIVQVFSIHFTPMSYQAYPAVIGSNNSAISNANLEVLDAALKRPPIQTSYLNIVGRNTIAVRYIHRPSFAFAFLKCRLSNDEGLTTIRAQAMRDFAEMCVLATKHYSYNKLDILIDQGQLMGGMNVGTFRERVSEYRDANDLYREALNKWQGISVLNDPESRRDHFRLITLG